VHIVTSHITRVIVGCARPAYRDLENPNAALFHIQVEDVDRAMGWSQSNTFRAATQQAKVTGRTFYDAHPRS
jgi:hypothetical protein